MAKCSRWPRGQGPGPPIRRPTGGAGSLAAGAATFNSDGSILTTPALGGSLPYAVAMNGSLTAGGDYVGGVSSSGRFAVFAGGDDSGDDPQLWFLLR